jgi:hypothetical protein
MKGFETHHPTNVLLEGCACSSPDPDFAVETGDGGQLKRQIMCKRLDAFRI